MIAVIRKLWMEGMCHNHKVYYHKGCIFTQTDRASSRARRPQLFKLMSTLQQILLVRLVSIFRRLRIIKPEPNFSMRDRMGDQHHPRLRFLIGTRNALERQGKARQSKALRLCSKDCNFTSESE